MNNIQRNFLQSTHLLFPDRYTERHILEDYYLNELYSGMVLEASYPRNKVFTEKAKTPPPKRLSLNKIAYMPTWRGAASRVVDKSFIDAVVAFLDEADVVFPDDCVLYVKLHSLMKGSVDFGAYAKVRPFPEGMAPYDFLAQCDALITDYSSVMFDFALSRRPVFLLAWDWRNYQMERGTYVDIKALPFPLYEDCKSLFDDLFGDCRFFETNRDSSDEAVGAFSYVPERNLLNACLGDCEGFLAKNADGVKCADVVFCKNCITSTDIKMLEDWMLENDDLLLNPIVMLPESCFSDSIRAIVGKDIKGLFGRVAIVKGKNPWTYADRFSAIFKSEDSRRILSDEAHVRRHLPGINVRKLIVFDAYQKRKVNFR